MKKLHTTFTVIIVAAAALNLLAVVASCNCANYHYCAGTVIIIITNATATTTVLGGRSAAELLGSPVVVAAGDDDDERAVLCPIDYVHLTTTHDGNGNAVVVNTMKDATADCRNFRTRRKRQQQTQQQPRKRDGQHHYRSLRNNNNRDLELFVGRYHRKQATASTAAQQSGLGHHCRMLPDDSLPAAADSEITIQFTTTRIVVRAYAARFSVDHDGDDDDDDDDANDDNKNKRPNSNMSKKKKKKMPHPPHSPQPHPPTTLCCNHHRHDDSRNNINFAADHNNNNTSIAKSSSAIIRTTKTAALYRKQNRAHRGKTTGGTGSGAGAGSSGGFGDVSSAGSDKADDYLNAVAVAIAAEKDDANAAASGTGGGGAAATEDLTFHNIRSTIHEMADMVPPLTNDNKKIATIVNLIAYGNLPDTDPHVFLQEIRLIDPDGIDVIEYLVPDGNADPNYPGVVSTSSESDGGGRAVFTDANINYRDWNRHPDERKGGGSRRRHPWRADTKKLFVLKASAASKFEDDVKLYALFDPADNLVYKLDIREGRMKVLDANIVKSFDGSTQRYPLYFQIATIEDDRGITAFAVETLRSWRDSADLGVGVYNKADVIAADMRLHRARYAHLNERVRRRFQTAARNAMSNAAYFFDPRRTSSAGTTDAAEPVRAAAASASAAAAACAKMGKRRLANKTSQMACALKTIDPLYLARKKREFFGRKISRAKIWKTFSKHVAKVYSFERPSVAIVKNLLPEKASNAVLIAGTSSF